MYKDFTLKEEHQRKDHKEDHQRKDHKETLVSLKGRIIRNGTKGGVQGDSTAGATLLGGEQPLVAPSVTAFGSYSKGALEPWFP